jgi:glycosyltransferase involved in cell wall biosynthesis
MSEHPGDGEPVTFDESVSIVVPAMDEAESLPALVEQLHAVRDAHGLALEQIILVDDGSSDTTWTVMTGLAADHADVEALRLRRNFGKATALMVGIGQARGAVIVTMDADLQDDPAELPQLLARIAEGCHVVSGWKRVRHDPVGKTLPSRLFNWVTAKASGIPLHDFNCGYKAYRREVFNRVQLYGELHRYVPVLAHALGFRIGEVAVRHHPRRHGRSKYGMARFLRGFLDLLSVMMITRFAYRPGHLFGGVGTLFVAIGGVALTWLTGLKLFTGADIGDRPLLLLGVMLVIVGIQLLLFGLLAELIISRTQRGNEYDDLVVEHSSGTAGD